MNEELRAKAVLTVEEVQQVLRLGRNKAYEFLKSEECPVPIIWVGHQIRVPSRQFFKWMDNLEVAAWVG